MNKVAVIGAGNWGATLAALLANQRQNVYLWTHSANHIPDSPAHVCSDLNNVVSDSQVVVIAVASKFYRQTVQQLVPFLAPEAYILNATKGLEVETGKRMSEILYDVLPQSFHDNIAVLSGPNLAKEIMEEKPAAAVIASRNNSTAAFLQKLFATSYFRVYTNTDVIGVELGGTLKNIFGIAAGISDGYNFGNNAKSALMVRGLLEISRLGKALGGNQLTFYGLSGMGDLLTTCSSPLSRNYQVGMALAKGKKTSEIEASMTEIAEGISTTKVAHRLAQEHNLELPIIAQMYKVLFNDKNPHDGVLELMLRDLKSE